MISVDLHPTPPFPPPPINPVHIFPWLIALLIALVSVLACACLTATLLFLAWRRRRIKEEPEIPNDYKEGVQDKWISFFPDPPRPEALHVFMRGTEFDDGAFRPQVTPAGKLFACEAASPGATAASPGGGEGEVFSTPEGGEGAEALMGAASPGSPEGGYRGAAPPMPPPGRGAASQSAAVLAQRFR